MDKENDLIVDAYEDLVTKKYGWRCMAEMVDTLWNQHALFFAVRKYKNVNRWRWLDDQKLEVR